MLFINEHCLVLKRRLRGMLGNGRKALKCLAVLFSDPVSFSLGCKVVEWKLNLIGFQCPGYGLVQQRKLVAACHIEKGEQSLFWHQMSIMWCLSCIPKLGLSSVFRRYPLHLQ